MQKFLVNIRGVYDRSLKIFKDQVNEAFLGHPLFHMKNRARMQEMEQQFNTAYTSVGNLLSSALDAGSLSNQLSKISVDLAKELMGTEIDLEPIDKIVAEDEALIELTLSHYQEMQDEVGPMLKTRDSNGGRAFLNIKDDGLFEADGQTYTKADVTQMAKEKKLTVTGEMSLAILNHRGHGLTVGGKVTASYYDELFAKAEKIAGIWDQPFNLKYVVHDFSVDEEKLNLRQTAATMRVIDKVASRNLIVNGRFDPASDVADHAGFLGGKETLPVEFAHNVEVPPKSAIDKQDERIKVVSSDLDAMKNELPADEFSALTKKYQASTKEPAYLQRVLEERRRDMQSNLKLMKDDLALEQVFLGGTLNKTYQDGVVNRSHRYPTGFNFLLNAQEITLPLLELTSMHRSNYCIGTVKAIETEEKQQKIFTSANDIFSNMLAPEKLPYRLGNITPSR